ncbi:MAG: histone family protein [Methanosarcinales archaeon]|nr:histone [Methanosarcinales archaeon]
MANIPIAPIVRIAKDNKVERIGTKASMALVEAAEDYVAKVAKRASELAKHAGRKTVKEEDVTEAVKQLQ